MEIYAYGENIPIALSVNPDLILLTTSFEGSARERHRVWRELLRGTRGLVLWDSDREFVGKDGDLGKRGRAAAPYFHEIRRGLGALLINSRRPTRPVAILYSPASSRVQWLLDRRASAEEWSTRTASREYEDDAIRASTRQFAQALEHMGVEYRFVSSHQLRRGELRDGNCRILLLPHTIAIAEVEAAEIREFVARGGVVIADGEPGPFDEHGRRLEKAALSDVFPTALSRSGASFTFGQGRAVYSVPANGHDRRNTRRLSQILDAAGVKPTFGVLRTDGQPAGDVETRIFENGELTIGSFQRDYHPPSDREDRETVVLTMPSLLNVYNLRERRALGSTDRLELQLDAINPVLLTLSEKPIAPPSIDGPRRAHPGETVEFKIGSDSPTKHAVIHVDVVDPDGSAVDYYSGNLLASGPVTAYTLPLAFSDKIGTWKLRATDLPSGQTVTAELHVDP
jgi:hypothetical protein